MTRAGLTARPSPIAAARRLSIAYLSYRRLYPLWRALCAAHPDIALLPAQGPVADALAVRDLDLRLYRRVIEIRDGMLLLHPHAGPAVMARARAHAERTGIPAPDVPAYAEAASLVAALQATAPTSPAPTSPAPMSPATGAVRSPAQADDTTAPTSDGGTTRTGEAQSEHDGTNLCAEIAYLTRVAHYFRRLTVEAGG